MYIRSTICGIIPQESFFGGSFHPSSLKKSGQFVYIESDYSPRIILVFVFSPMGNDNDDEDELMIMTEN